MEVAASCDETDGVSSSRVTIIHSVNVGESDPDQSRVDDRFQKSRQSRRLLVVNQSRQLLYRGRVDRGSLADRISILVASVRISISIGRVTNGISRVSGVFLTSSWTSCRCVLDDWVVWLPCGSIVLLKLQWDALLTSTSHRKG